MGILAILIALVSVAAFITLLTMGLMGLRSSLAAYELDELSAIGQLMLQQSRYYLSEAAERAFRDYLTHRMQQPRFANARSVRNELERARLRHAHRLASDLHRHWTRDDLMRIEPEDIFFGSADLLVEQFRS